MTLVPAQTVLNLEHSGRFVGLSAPDGRRRETQPRVPALTWNPDGGKIAFSEEAALEPAPAFNFVVTGTHAGIILLAVIVAIIVAVVAMRRRMKREPPRS